MITIGNWGYNNTHRAEIRENNLLHQTKFYPKPFTNKILKNKNALINLMILYNYSYSKYVLILKENLAVFNETVIIVSM